MSDLVTCPKCGLSQSARHAFCARCDHSFDGPVDTQDYTPSQPSGTPTDQPEGTPTDRSSTPDLPPAPPAPLPERPRGRRPGLNETAESPPDDTVEEALPDAPSWDLPNRPPSSNPGRSRLETARSQAPGLARNRGSLAQRMSSGSIDKVPDSLATERPPGDPGPGDARTAGDLRGRPPSSFYPSENSAPPGDPLMAALVSGDDLGMAPLPPPDILADELVVGNPPVHRTDPGARNPLYPDGPVSDADFGGPRVVPPSTKRRASVGSASQKSIRRDPRGRAVASAPSPRGGILPDAASAPGRSAPGRSAPGRVGPGRSSKGIAVPPPEAPRSRPGARPPIGRTGGSEELQRSGRIGSMPGVPGSASARDIPLPPPPTDLGRTPRQPVNLKGLVIRGVVILVAVLVIWAAWDVWQLFSNLGTLNAVVTSGNTATPALVGELDEQIRVLGVEADVTERWARISGETDTYSIGVEVRHRVIIFPAPINAQRDGPFRVEQKLATLEYFVENGWQLDSTAETRLRTYEDRRNERNRAAPPPEPTPSPEEGVEPPAEGGG